MALYSIQTHGELDLSREWLLTNGLGGYASSSIVGCNTRRYHGLLCAATLPPVGRIMGLNRIGETLLLEGDRGRPLEFSVNQFGQDFHPRGERYLRRFELEDTARWEYEIEGVAVSKELQICWKRNVAAIRYTLRPDRTRAMALHLLPFIALRDFHGLRRHEGAALEVEVDRGQIAVADPRHATLYLRAEGARFVREENWWHGHTYAVETGRGLDDAEDLFHPGRFILEAEGEASVTLWTAMEQPLTGMELEWDHELQRRRKALSAVVRPGGSPALQRLERAANDFIVYRKAPDGSDAASILAGYPWFADWGRDTMIALPGLLLTTGRYEEARRVLCLFAEYVSDGMIPNRFDDYTNEPHYNTVDASLWFVHAAFEYARMSEDRQTFDKALRPACRKIIDGYRAGTRFGIRMDEADGLITQGDEQTQLTWMDAKCSGIAFTPRQGKPVEINALWYNALVLMDEQRLAEKVAASFRDAFWINSFRGLADVINDRGQERSLRPNQIFAVSLPHTPLTPEQQRAVVEVVRRELLTPCGLRTLAASDPKYHGRYAGTQMQRDEAYHNGTVWPWPLGAFLEAYLKVHNRSPEALEQVRQWLRPLIAHMEQACIGQISEIFEGDEPHRPAGCYAQAWSVAEVLRLAAMVGV